MAIDGIFNLVKPVGMTSFQVVAQVRRITGERRAGHTGTLDPAACGVLPLCVGRATRVVEFMSGHSKAYRAVVRLGQTTDTDDAEGQVIAQADPSAVTRSGMEQALTRFRGPIQQRPPRYSAIQQQGRRLYELARRGVSFVPPERPVHVYHLELLAFQLPELTLEVVCGKGTYIRSLARDLGAVLGCGGHLASLVRTRSGPFLLEDALSLAELEHAVNAGYWRSVIYPLDWPLLEWKAAILSGEHEQAACHGREVPLPSLADGSRCRVYNAQGEFVAILRQHGDTWKAQKVFALARTSD